jgi:hypothetical protein
MIYHFLCVPLLNLFKRLFYSDRRTSKRLALASAPLTPNPVHFDALLLPIFSRPLHLLATQPFNDNPLFQVLVTIFTDVFSFSKI